MVAEELKIVFKFGTLADLSISAILTVLARHQIPFADFDLFGKQVNLDEISLKKNAAYRKGFTLRGQGFEFIFGSLPGPKLDFLCIKAISGPKILWDEWALEFVSDLNFTMAWVVDCDYDHWQNAKDPLQYTAVGRSYSHLPMKSNELPYPLEKQIIDTSANPGRWCFRDGYIEAVGATMWFGERFWSLTGADKWHVENDLSLSVSHPAPSVTKIQTADHCFTKAEGRSGEIQSKLRSLLFPRNVLPHANLSDEH